MSNVLDDEKRQQILALGRLGWSLRRIERATGVRRETASGYLKAAGLVVQGRDRPRTRPSNPAISAQVSTDPSAGPAAGTGTGTATPVAGDRPTPVSMCRPGRALTEPGPRVAPAIRRSPSDKERDPAGNHEFFDNQARPKDYGFDAVYPTLMCDSDPPLLLTHEPLETVPAGCASVHGHLHGAPARSAARRSRRQLNVNVELTAYRPVRLAGLAATARALLAGDVEPQATTAHTVALARRRGRRSEPG